MKNKITLKKARLAKVKALMLFKPLVEVIGIGITNIDGEYGLKVNIVNNVNKKLPVEVDGVSVKIEVVGTISVY